jgi:hypothetical protein
MKEHGLLCTSSVALAMHEGRQTQDRRPMNPQPTHSLVSQSEGYSGSWYGHGECNGKSEVWKCPVQVGDIFYIREPYYAYGRWITRYSAKKGRDEWHFEDMTEVVGEVYQFYEIVHFIHAEENNIGWYKRPSLFMPKEASRTRKRVTGIRVEHGPEISEEDAIAEGAIFTDYGRWCFHQGGPRCDVGNCPAPNEHHQQKDGWAMERTSSTEQCYAHASIAFRALWHDLYGDDKPWRWVYELEDAGK